MTFPGFIRNGNYYFTELDVYADGVVECWGAVDLRFLSKKFAENWISPGVPNGATVSVHDVIQAKVVSGKWSQNPQLLHERLLDGVRNLNPSQENLIDFEGNDVEVRDGVRYAKIGLTEASPQQKALGDRSPAGKSRYALVRHEGQVFLTTIRIYADGKIDIHPRYGHERLVDLSTFGAMISSNDVCVTVPNGTSIELDTLGRFKVTDVWSYVEQPEDFFREVAEVVGKLNGRPDSLTYCREVYEQYLEHPTVKQRDILRQAYEAIPEHHRMYVGDMDTKDIAVRMIIYGDEEIEGWSHRAVARAQGDDVLPSINVPKPIDEDEE